MALPDPASLTLERDEAPGLRAWLKSPADWLVMILGTLYWGVFGSLLTVLGLMLRPFSGQIACQRLGRFLLHVLFRVFARFLRIMRVLELDAGALSKLSRTGGPMILAPNHAALWDAVFIISRVPGVVCVMKKSILRNPFLGGGARLAGFIANDGMTRTIRAATKSLHSGSRLLFFPEGTRTTPDARWINPLKGGCALIAMRSGVPVHPIFIRSSSRFLQKGWPLWRRPVFPIHIRIDVGEPLVPEPGESAHSFTLRLQAIFEQELSRPHELRRQITHGGGSSTT
ncbi:MAG: 1-acyl-sn-glycerol-3-phosphate acyltransferase [Akkermansiaceae bacterium]|nr:1-acyl-sn-glycerol-3-phosphate acyltransferase [Akkermansiaceae bacterium]